MVTGYGATFCSRIGQILYIRDMFQFFFLLSDTPLCAETDYMNITF